MNVQWIEVNAVLTLGTIVETGRRAIWRRGERRVKRVAVVGRSQRELASLDRRAVVLVALPLTLQVAVAGATRHDAAVLIERLCVVRTRQVADEREVDAVFRVLDERRPRVQHLH